MKKYNSISNRLKFLRVMIPDIAEDVHKEIVQNTYNDIIENAPFQTGTYAESIKIEETTYEGSKMSTKITTDLMVGPAKSTGMSYNLGKLLEYGTDPHAIPNAFNWGIKYGFDSEMYKRTLDPDWHPGTGEYPHFTPAYLKNIALYKKYMKNAIHSAIRRK